MKRIAVIGSGISGLSAAYYLSRRYEIHLFERDNRLGGHTNTVMVESSRGLIPVDTGFIVHNDSTYPNFCRLMRELGVETQPSDMSFAVTGQDGGFEYSSRGLGGFFAQRRNYFSRGHYTLLREILRFNREAPRLLGAGAGRAGAGAEAVAGAEAGAGADWGAVAGAEAGAGAEQITLGEFLDAGGYSSIFVDRYLVPMAAAVWSMAPDAMPGFPALTLIRFMQNHGMLGINTHPRWKTIRGGSHSYLPALTAPFRQSIIKDATIRSIDRSASGVTLRFEDRPARHFDEVVFACHGDQILPLLAQPTDLEREVLSCFTTSRNEACLHTDSSLLPRRPAARASWNYLLGDAGKVTMTYHMNRLQSLNTVDAVAQNGARREPGPGRFGGARPALCAADELAQNGARRRLGPGRFGGARGALCTVDELAQNGTRREPGPDRFGGARPALCTLEDYCVTLNANGRVNPARALRRMVYEHPLYTRAAIRAQERWADISGKNHTHFCGAYWFYGFHEDGVRSALRVAEALGVHCS